VKKEKVTGTKYLIVGNSAGGIGAAEAIRERDKVNQITIISQEPYSAYSRPLISKLVSGKCTVDQILFRSPDFYQENGVSFIPGNKVISLEPDKHVVRLEDGSQITWEKLLLATGGTPVVPKINSAIKRGMFNFQNIEDALAISDYIKTAHNAIIMGGGLIGLSLAESLLKRGLNVSIVEQKDRILNTILDEAGSAIAAEAVMKKGVNLITNHSVTQVSGKSVAYAVILDSGQKVPCDILIVAVGVTPSNELALSSGIKVNRGILVDGYMRTSHPDIYACGDVAEAYDFITGNNRVIPIWPNAYIGGRTAGFNMVGFKMEYPRCTVMNSLNYFGVDIVTAGIVNTPVDCNSEVITSRNDSFYKKIILENDLIKGLVFINDIEKAGMIFGLMRDKINTKRFKHRLLSDDFGLAYLPDEIRHERLGITVPEPVEKREPVLSRR
jgi:NAD(P)H-nitrite reductase large subunit